MGGMALYKTVDLQKGYESAVEGYLNSRQAVLKEGVYFAYFIYEDLPPSAGEGGSDRNLAG